MTWACPSCWCWLESRCVAGLLIAISGHLIGAHSTGTPAAYALERNRRRQAVHAACTPTTCADPRPARQ